MNDTDYVFSRMFFLVLSVLPCFLIKQGATKDGKEGFLFFVYNRRKKTNYIASW